MKKISLFALSLSLGLTCVSLLSSPSNAQSDPNENVYQNNENSSIYGGDSTFNPMQLIHNSRLNNGRNSAEFQQDSSQKIVNAADNYNSSQDNASLMRYWKEQQQAQPTPQATPAPTEVEISQ